jgi:glycosyltransferase involved in cell wall biosynthesis
MTRVAICTPIDRRSAIARCTADLAGVLAHTHEVTLFVEPTDRPIVCRDVPLRPLLGGGGSLAALMSHEVVITVLGDSPFHSRTFQVARTIPSITILHDIVLAHLIAGELTGPDLRDALVRWYGDDATEAAATVDGPQPFWATNDVAQFPLFEPAIELALGVVVHSAFAARCVAPKTIAPLAVVPLAYRAADDARFDETDDVDHPTLLTLGHANENKCHELVIEALSELRMTELRYVIAGPISDPRRRRLTSLALALGVAEQVVILGAVSDADVSRLVGASTICMNLRSLAMEGASASLIEQMLAAKPVVVFDHGCYAETPDGCAVKIPAASSPVDLAEVVRGLLNDPDQRAAIGAAAHEHATLVHGVESYARRLLAFVEDAKSSRPYLDLAHATASVTRRWNMPSGSPVSTRIAAAISSMFGEVEPFRS